MSIEGNLDREEQVVKASVEEVAVVEEVASIKPVTRRGGRFWAVGRIFLATTFGLGLPTAAVIAEQYLDKTPSVSAAGPSCLEMVVATNNFSRTIEVFLIDGATGRELDRETIGAGKVIELRGTGESNITTKEGKPGFRSTLKVPAENKVFPIEGECNDKQVDFRFGSTSKVVPSDRTPQAGASARAEAAGGNANANANNNQNILNLNLPGLKFESAEGTPTSQPTQKPSETASPTASSTPAVKSSEDKSEPGGLEKWMNDIDGGRWFKTEVRYTLPLLAILTGLTLIQLIRALRSGRVVVEHVTTTPPTPPAGGEGEPQPTQPTQPADGAPQAAEAKPKGKKILGVIPRPRNPLRRVQEESPEEKIQKLEAEKTRLEKEKADASNAAVIAEEKAKIAISDKNNILKQAERDRKKAIKLEKEATALKEAEAKRIAEEEKKREARREKRRKPTSPATAGAVVEETVKERVERRRVAKSPAEPGESK